VTEQPGLIELTSAYDFVETLSRLEGELAARPVEVFARIDHAANAAAVGLAMPPTVVIVFGNARAGTPLMLAHPRLALDLPLRLLIRQDSEGVVVAYHDPVALLGAFGVGADEVAALHVVAAIASTIV
jgi:uncharacterized protein (DUF302 family)